MRNSEQGPARSVWEWLPTILTVFGLLAGLAYFLGKEYTDAYYEGFGIPPSAVRLSPPEYMFASKRFFLFLVFTVGILALYWFTPRRSESPTVESSVRQFSAPKALQLVADSIVIVADSIVSIFPEWDLAERWRWTLVAANKVTFLGAPFLLYMFWLAGAIPFWVVPAFVFPYIVIAGLLWMGNKVIFVSFAAISLSWGILLFLVVAPASLAERDAERIIDDPERLPEVEVLWVENTGGLTPLPIDEKSGTSRARMLLANSDTYYLLVESGESIEVVAVRANSTQAIRYYPDID